MNCEMCGREGGLFKTDVEGSLLNLCEGCSKFGRVVSHIKAEKKEAKKEHKTEKPAAEKEIALSIAADYGEIIKKKREQLGINQEDFAKQINEKVSLIHKTETGQFEPSIALARKIEKFLHIALIEQQEIKDEKIGTAKGEHFTIGDFVKIKKQKQI